MKMNYIDITGINCWIINLIPFIEGERNSNEVKEYQIQCIENQLFGMGWNSPEDALFNNNVELNQETMETFLKYSNRDNNLVNALNDYQKIKIGDYAIMRLRDSHFYIGKVKRAAYYCNGEDCKVHRRLSWCCKVEKWVKFNSEELPSEICARLAQSNQKTINPIKDYRLKLLIFKAFNFRYDKPDENFRNIPKIRLTEKNFCRSLYYSELEDLVSLYIYEKHSDEGYFLLSSSCKVNQQKYEYMYVNNDSRRKQPIVCQVKNQEKINISDYNNDESFEKIYLFSGRWTDSDVKNYNEEYKNKNIYVISSSELFKTLKSFSYLTNKMEEYYEVSELNEKFPPFNLEGLYIVNKKFSSAQNKRNQIQIKIGMNEEKVYFNSYGLYYSYEFNSLIKSENCNQDSNIERVKEILAKIIN